MPNPNGGLRPNSLIIAAQRRVWLCTAATAIGIYLGSVVDMSSVVWIGGCVLGATLCAITTQRWLVGLLCAFLCFGGAWFNFSVREVPERSTLLMHTGNTALLRAYARFVQSPQALPAPAGVLGSFTLRGNGQRALLALESIETSPGNFTPADSFITLYVQQSRWPAPAAAGDRALVMGNFTQVPSPSNPGEPDSRLISWDRGNLGLVTSSSWDVVTLLPDSHDITYYYYRATQALRDRATSIVTSAAGNDASSRALLIGLLLGQQEPMLRETYDLFARAGLVHILSISGFHLGLMAWLALLAVRLTGDRGRIEALLVGVLVLLYTLILPAQSPLLRSAAMVLTLLVVQATGKRYDHLTLLGWITFGLLVWRPTELWSLGFALSIGLTAILFWLADDFTYILARPPLRGTIRFRERPLPDRLRHAFCAAFTSNVLCWSVSLPLLMCITGIISPAGVILSLLLTPVFMLVLALGYIALLAGLLLGWLIPGVESLCSWTISSLLTLNIACVRVVDSMPLASLRVPPTPILWGLATTAAFVIFARGLARVCSYKHPNTRIMPLAAVCLLLLAAAPVSWYYSIRGPSDVILRCDMLNVGNGTSIIIRAPEADGTTRAMLWDCGTLGGAGGYNTARTVLRAARSLGVASIPTVVISHPDLDHFGALPELIEPLGVQNVLVPRRFIEQATTSPTSAAGVMLAYLQRRNITITTIASGDSVNLGILTCTVLSPPPIATFEHDNDHSITMRIDRGGQQSRPLMLLTGDIQDAAIGYIETTHPDISPLILELPHHGSARSAAIAWVQKIKPDVILQSTGPSRTNDPRWLPALSGHWLCTATDGASTAIVHTDGSVSVARYRSFAQKP